MYRYLFTETHIYILLNIYLDPSPPGTDRLDNGTLTECFVGGKRKLGLFSCLLSISIDILFPPPFLPWIFLEFMLELDLTPCFSTCYVYTNTCSYVYIYVYTNIYIYIYINIFIYILKVHIRI
jgi:hypothetical protein